MEVEKLATSAVTRLISKTDILSSYINSADKEPCYDGYICIHEDKKRSKKNLKKVYVQIKGKTVKKSEVKRTINYRMSYDDLNAYTTNGGAILFVVYIDKDTGDLLEVYYSELLPIKTKEFIKIKKRRYPIKCRKFPTNNTEITELVINFFENSIKQASFGLQNTPTIKQLTEKGMLESIVFRYTCLEKHSLETDLPKILEGKSVTVYGKLEECEVEIPIEYYEEVRHITMSRNVEAPISIDGRVFYDKYSLVATAETIENRIGKCVTFAYPNDSKRSNCGIVQIKISGNLDERITASEFAIALYDKKHFFIGDCRIDVRVSDKDFEKFNTESFRTNLNSYHIIKYLLSFMNVKKGFNVSECTKEDIEHLNILVGTLLENKKVKDNPYEPLQFVKQKIANLTLAIVYIKNESGGYNVYDYFNNHLNTVDKNNDRISQFTVLSYEDYLQLDNLNLDVVIEDFKLIDSSKRLIEDANNTMLKMLKAYDISKNTIYMDAAKKILMFIENNLDYISEDVVILNKLQMVLRERSLTFEEKNIIYSLISRTDDDSLKVGGLLLLNEQEEAKNMLESLEPRQLEIFKEYPIYTFFKGEQ